MTGQASCPEPHLLAGRICRTIRQQALIPAGSHVVVALSGGADSMALLSLLLAVQQPLSFSCSCVHIHHGIRGAAADGDRDFVAAFCRQQGIDLEIRSFDLPALAAQAGLGLELAGRQVRQQVFEDLRTSCADRGQPVLIALAHHLDDQAETLLMHLGRGAGLDGLSGMKKKDGFLIRPLLDLRRSDLEAYLQQQQIPWRHDATNDLDFTIRNRLRHHLLPLWETLLGGDPIPSIGRAALNLEADRQLIDHIIQQATDRCLQDGGINRAAYLDHGAVFHPRLIRCFWERATGQRQHLAQKHIQLMQDWIPRAQAWQSLDLPDRWTLLFDGKVLRLERKMTQDPDKQALELDLPLAIPGVTPIPGTPWSIRASWQGDDKERGDRGRRVRVAGDRAEAFRLRTRRPGDRILLGHRDTPQRLKRYLQQQRIHPADRDRLLLLMDGPDLVWFPGGPVGHQYRLPKAGQAPDRLLLLDLFSNQSLFDTQRVVLIPDIG